MRCHQFQMFTQTTGKGELAFFLLLSPRSPLYELIYVFAHFIVLYIFFIDVK